MRENYSAKATIQIDASPAKVWDALTRPEMIRQYLFGTEVDTDWKVGSPIRYRGVWQGKPYEDKGQIIQVEPEKCLRSTFWSALSGDPDLPEYYKTVSYELIEKNGGTSLTVTQDNNASEDEAKHSEGNWLMVLEGLKRLVESPTH